MKTVLIILTDGFEEIEGVAPIDLLRRAGAQVTLASCTDSLEVTGKCAVVIKAEVFLDDCLDNDFDLLVLPGGPGTFDLRKDERVLELVQSRHAKGLPQAAICAAPLILLDAGILNGKTYTAHFTCSEELPELREDLAVVEDEEIITSRGAGTAVAFGLRLVALLFGEEKANEIAASIHA
ncbi:MAG: DJ-1/PfpI family protein [Verrucomicrobia bacterium]|nr:DJ-1/PfpI family protein [Verrucomicrobiota bacterium]MDA0723441.1 DJ-1/PfpI family protein [Verrucomicrobiota bacterium]MDA1046649.1 DJ-1/PfpI family protein [Verrucomicrobiota bacterium]